MKSPHFNDRPLGSSEQYTELRLARRNSQNQRNNKDSYLDDGPKPKPIPIVLPDGSVTQIQLSDLVKDSPLHKLLKRAPLDRIYKIHYREYFKSPKNFKVGVSPTLMPGFGFGIESSDGGVICREIDIEFYDGSHHTHVVPTKEGNTRYLPEAVPKTFASSDVPPQADSKSWALVLIVFMVLAICVARSDKYSGDRNEPQSQRIHYPQIDTKVAKLRNGEI